MTERKLLVYECWNSRCGERYSADQFAIDQTDVKCTKCGGAVISPSGKVKCIVLDAKHEIPTPEMIQELLDGNYTITLEEMANILDCSVSTVEKVMRENNLRVGHRGRKIPMSEADLLTKIEDMLKHDPKRKEVAEALNVSATTVSTYVKRLKEAGRLDPNFAFKRGRPIK